jgi:predicted permease
MERQSHLPALGRIALLADHLRGELGHALRSLCRSPVFSVVAILSLALGIGCTTAFFSAVNVVFLRPQPLLREPKQLVSIGTRTVYSVWGSLSYPEYEDIKQDVPALAALAAVAFQAFTMSEDDGPERTLQGEVVSAEYFEVLGVTMPLGRGFTAEDAASGRRVAVLGHHTWERDFGGSSLVLGHTIRINGQDHTVIGVAPARLQAWRQPTPADLWLPIPSTWRTSRGHCALHLVGRMRPGVSLRQVQAQLDQVAARLVEEHPRMWRDNDGNLRRFVALSERDSRVPPEQRPAVLAATVMVTALLLVLLLVVCTNVATLVLGRVAARERETAVRLALGASRCRLVGHFLAEVAALSVAAGGSAVLVIHWLTALLARGEGPLGVPGALDLTLDARVALFAIGLVMVTTLASGLAPALRASRRELVPALQGASSTGGRRVDLRSILVIAQVAGAAVLVVPALLLLRSLDESRRVDLGFERSGVALLSVDHQHRQYSQTEGRQVLDELVGRVRALPGVESAAVARTVPLGFVRMYVDIHAAGAPPSRESAEAVSGNMVSPGFFELLRIPLLGGRDFSETDRDGAQPVVIVNQTLAERWWPGEDPIGRHVEGERSAEVIGVVADARLEDPTEKPRPAVWYPVEQWYSAEATILARATADPGPLLGALRAEVREIDPDLPVMSLGLLDQLETDAALSRRVIPQVLALLGALCLGLATIGIYGVVAHAVARRTREIGVRMSLGARRGAMVAMVVRQALTLAGIGLAVGIVVAIGVALAMRSLLFGVGPLDPISLAFTAAVVLVTAAGAGTIPGIRAARLDPVQVLRTE